MLVAEGLVYDLAHVLLQRFSFHLLIRVNVCVLCVLLGGFGCARGWVGFPFFFLGWGSLQAPHLMAEQPSADEVLDRALTSDFGDFGFSREKQAARGVKVGGGGGGRHALGGGGGERFPHPQDPIIKSLEGAFDMSGFGEVGGVAKSLKVSPTLHPMNFKLNIWPSVCCLLPVSVSRR